MVPTQISCKFFFPKGVLWQVFSGLRSNHICFVSGCAVLLGFSSFSSFFCTLGLYCNLLTLYVGVDDPQPNWHKA